MFKFEHSLFCITIKEDSTKNTKILRYKRLIIKHNNSAISIKNYRIINNFHASEQNTADNQILKKD